MFVHSCTTDWLQFGIKKGKPYDRLYSFLDLWSRIHVYDSYIGFIGYFCSYDRVQEFASTVLCDTCL